MSEKTYTIKQAAIISGYSERQMRQKCIDGCFPGAKKITNGRKWIIPESALYQTNMDGKAKEAVIEQTDSLTGRDELHTVSKAYQEIQSTIEAEAKDQLWSLGSLEKLNFPAEALPTILEIQDLWRKKFPKLIGIARTEKASSYQPKQARPSIRVTPKTIQGQRSMELAYHLEIHNTGIAGEFEAEVEIVSSSENQAYLPKKYTAFWLNTKEHKTKIKNGFYDEIVIAKVDTTIELAPYLRLYFYDHDQARIRYIVSTAFILGMEQSEAPWFILQVKIGSDPEMEHGPTIKQYKLELHQLIEMKVT